MDLAIVERAASLFRPLGSADGWAVHFGRELNATDDRHAFRPIGSHHLPVVEGKHLEPFQVALGSASLGIRASDAARLLRSDRHERPRLAYRDIASATNRLTLIAAVLPPRCVSIHTVFCLRTQLPSRAQHLLCGLFNSLVVNYLVRLRVTHACDHGNDRTAADPDLRGRSGGMPGDRDAGTAAGQAARRLGLRLLERQGRGAVPTERRGVRAHPGDVSAHSRDRAADAALRSFCSAETQRNESTPRWISHRDTETQRLTRIERAHVERSSAVRSKFTACWDAACSSRSIAQRWRSSWTRAACRTYARFGCPR